MPPWYWFPRAAYQGNCRVDAGARLVASRLVLSDGFVRSGEQTGLLLEGTFHSRPWRLRQAVRRAGIGPLFPATGPTAPARAGWFAAVRLRGHPDGDSKSPRHWPRASRDRAARTCGLLAILLARSPVAARSLLRFVTSSAWNCPCGRGARTHRKLFPGCVVEVELCL